MSEERYRPRLTSSLVRPFWANLNHLTRIKGFSKADISKVIAFYGWVLQLSAHLGRLENDIAPNSFKTAHCLDSSPNVPDSQGVQFVLQRVMIIKPPTLNYRQKALINLLKALGGRVSGVDFQKYLFLYTQEYELTPSFEFVPYRFGCFSFQSYADRRRLIEVGVLHDTDEWKLKGVAAQSSIDLGNDLYAQFRKRYEHMKGDRLVQEVYRRYPYYAIHSEITGRLMNSKERDAIEAARPSAARACLFTIGYEGSSFEGYLNRLLKQNVKTLVDVRRNPLSRKYGFSKKTLSDTAGKLGIDYVHIPELGIDSEQRQKLNTPADYARLFDRYERNELKQNGASLERLKEIAIFRKRVAITCFEADSCMCHRGRVTKALSCLPEWSLPVRHI